MQLDVQGFAKVGVRITRWSLDEMDLWSYWNIKLLAASLYTICFHILAVV